MSLAAKLWWLRTGGPRGYRGVPGVRGGLGHYGLQLGVPDGIHRGLRQGLCLPGQAAGPAARVAARAVEHLGEGERVGPHPAPPRATYSRLSTREQTKRPCQTGQGRAGGKVLGSPGDGVLRRHRRVHQDLGTCDGRMSNDSPRPCRHGLCVPPRNAGGRAAAEGRMEKR